MIKRLRSLVVDLMKMRGRQSANNKPVASGRAGAQGALCQQTTLLMAKQRGGSMVDSSWAVHTVYIISDSVRVRNNPTWQLTYFCQPLQGHHRVLL